MEHLTDNAFDRRGENNDFYKISSGQLLNTNYLLSRITGRQPIHALVNVTVFWKECKKWRSRTLKKEDDSRGSIFLRATQYHYLASYFKDVPLVTTVLSGEEANTVKEVHNLKY